jgi:hypothetical protein
MKFHPFVMAVLTALLLVCASLPAAAAARARGSKLNADVKCGVCSVLVDAVEDKVAAAAMEHPYTVLAGYRLDEKRHVPYARSQEFVEGLLDSASLFKHLWDQHGLLRSAAPQRLVRRSGAGSDARAVHTSSLKTQFAAVAADVFDRHHEALVLAVLRAGTRADTQQRFCVEAYRACAEWPVQWPEPTDPFPEPEPEPAAAPAPAEGAPAASDAAAPVPAETAVAPATELAPVVVAAATAGDNAAAPTDEGAKDEL